MSDEATFQTVRRLIEEICDLAPGTVQPKGRLLGYQLDSVRALDLIVALEDAHGLELEKDALMEVKTVDELCAFLDRARAAK